MTLNADRHEYVIEDLDDEHVIVHDNKVDELKMRLKEVSRGMMLYYIVQELITPRLLRKHNMPTSKTQDPTTICEREQLEHRISFRSI